MPLEYTDNMLDRLKRAGYSTYRLRRDKLLGESTIQLLRDDKPVSWDNIATLCRLIGCQPGDLLTYVDVHRDDRLCANPK
jgi:putative transcriptional regulator